MPWYVAAGWAIDLFLGGQRREHEDLEIAVPSSRFDEVVEALDGLEVFVIIGPAEPLRSPRRATSSRRPIRPGFATGTDLWRLDMFREPSDGDTWVCRRDESIRLPYDRVIERTEDGIPYGRPEIVLLYKAKHSHREGDRRLRGGPPASRAGAPAVARRSAGARPPRSPVARRAG